MSWITDPKKFMKLNAYCIVFFSVIIPVSYFLGWLSSTVYISALSLYAIVIAHLSTYAAARTEVMQSDADAKLHEAVKKLRKLDSDDDRE